MFVTVELESKSKNGGERFHHGLLEEGEYHFLSVPSVTMQFQMTPQEVGDENAFR